jgi:hypothetical protein
MQRPFSARWANALRRDGSLIGAGFLASREKARLDTVARARLQAAHLSPQDVLTWCVDSLRVEPESLSQQWEDGRLKPIEAD